MKLLPIAGQDLKGKIVLIRKSALKPEFREKDRRFLVEGGFGANPNLAGTAIFGTFLLDGEETRMSRGDVEGIVEEETKMDNLNAVQSELQREQAEAHDSLGVNEEAPYSPYPRTPPFVLPVQDTERDTFDSQDDGCTDSALCDDIKWGGPESEPAGE